MPASSSDDIRDLFTRAHAGDQEAAQILFDKWREPMLYVIRKQLDRRLRRIFDSTDFVQEALAELFARQIAVADFSTPQAFMAFVKRIAENKVRDSVRKHLQSQRSNISKEVPLDRLPTAEEARILCADGDGGPVEERLRARLEKLPLVHKKIMELWLDGHSPSAIAAALGLETKAVYRCMERSRQLMQR